MKDETAEAGPLLDARILVVEDEYYLADDLRSMLGRAGATVTGPVGTVDSAINAVEKMPMDCAVLDINLRGQTGFAVADLLKERDTPFVFATGYDPDTVPERFRNCPILQKPFTEVGLIDALCRAMGRDISVAPTSLASTAAALSHQ